MQVIRFALQAKNGCTNELVEWVKSWPDYGLPIPPHGWRVYWHTQFSPWDVVVNEIESLAEHEAWWKEWWAAPRAPEVAEKLGELTERGGGGEFWAVEVLK